MRFVDVRNMRRWIASAGPEAAITGLIDALERAAALWWHDRSGWEWRMRTAMEARHGWGPSAAEYLSLYQRLLGEWQ